MPWYDEGDIGGWDDRTSTLTFHTFRPKSPAELLPVSGVTHQMLNGTLERQKGTPHVQYKEHVEYNNPNIYRTSEPLKINQQVGPQRLYYYQTPEDAFCTDDVQFVDIYVQVALKAGENRVGFSMTGGHEDLPVVINNVLEGSPADRAGLCAGDEILEINDISVDGASYNELIHHIHQCIKSRNITLKIRRKPSIQLDSSECFGIMLKFTQVKEANPANSSLFTSDAYLVSVDPAQKRQLTDKLNTFHPNIRIFDMDTMVNGHQINNNIAHVHKNGHAVRHYSNGEVITEEETSFVNGNNKNNNNNNNNNNNHIVGGVGLKTQPISVGQFYGSKSSLKNGTIPAAATVVNTEENDKLKKYEQDLEKRRQVETKQAKEEEFLRSSLRGSKKLQALEQNDRNRSVSCHENIGFEEDQLENEEASIHRPTNQDRPIALDDVIMSVNRLTQVLDQMPEHRNESQFIRDVFADKNVQNAIEVTAVSKVHFSDREKLVPVSKTSFQDSKNIVHQLDDSVSEKAGHLQMILEKSHVKSVLYAHDKIAERLFEAEPSTSFDTNVYPNREILGLKETRLDGSLGAGNLRIIRLIKDGDHPLGATVKNDGEAIVIGRVVKGGVAEKSSLLKEGDEILDVNGIDVRGKSVHEVCDILANLTGELTFIVVPAAQDTFVDSPPHTVIKHVRALFNYDPEDDIYLPCRELGLHFGKGDILHVISMTDSNWWQALRDGEENMHQLAGLIPSASLQTQKGEYDREVKADLEKQNDDSSVGGFLCTKRKKQKQTPKLKSKDKIIAETTATEDDDIPTYEEVSLYLSPTGRRRPIVLIGPPHVGCLELRQKLMEVEKEKFAGVVPHTSRPRHVDEQDGVHYHFVSRQQFQDDVSNRRFVEWGEYQKHFYGTSFDSIKRVIERGKTCVLTLKAQSLKGLRNSDFMPFVVFISPPSFERLKISKLRQGDKDLKEDELSAIVTEAKETEEKFGHLFDKVLINFDFERTFQELRLAIHRLETEPQWIPSGWLKNPSASLSR